MGQIFEQNPPNKMLKESNISKKQASTAPVKFDLDDKIYHYKVRVTGLAELDLQFVIDQQLLDKRKVEEIFQVLN